VFMCTLSWRLTLVAFATVPPTIVVSNLYGNYVSTISKRGQTRLAAALTAAEEVLSAFPTVLALGATHAEADGHADALSDYSLTQLRLANSYAVYAVATTAVPMLISALVLYTGGKLISGGQMTGGQLVSFVLYQVSLAASFASMGDIFTGLMTAVGSAERLFALIDRQPRRLPLQIAHALPASTTTPPCAAAVELVGVSFAYPSRAEVPILRNLSLALVSGQTTAIVGASGSGKSSVCKLIGGMYEPQSGEVRVLGRPRHHWHPSQLSTLIATVQQEPVLFGRRIWECIAHGSTRVFDLSEEGTSSSRALVQWPAPPQ